MYYAEEVIDLTNSYSGDVFRTAVDVIELIDDSDSSFTSYLIQNRNSTNKTSKKTTHTKNSKEANNTKLRKQPNNNENPKEIQRMKRSSAAAFRLGDCPICWDELGKNPLASTKCGHVFCMKCLQRTLEAKKQCPTCRQVLKGSNSYHPLYIGCV